MTLHYADAEELAKTGGKLLSARGHLMADKRTNRLLIRDDARHLPALKDWAQEMDLPVGQVELAAHIVSMSETSLRELGVKWRLAEAGGSPGSGQITTLSSDMSVNDASTRAGFNIGKINGRLLELELSALERKQQVDIIASPRLLASHMQPASIKQGSEIPYQVSSGESGATSVEFKEAVLGMEVTPTVLQQGRVRLKLRISENTPGQVLKQEMARRWPLINRERTGGSSQRRDVSVGRHLFAEKQNRPRQRPAAWRYPGAGASVSSRRER